jgi:hypothetical protein
MSSGPLITKDVQGSKRNLMIYPSRPCPLKFHATFISVSMGK